MKNDEPDEPYDKDLQMYVKKPSPPNLNTLTFLRWLAEKGQLEHSLEGPATGGLAEWGKTEGLITSEGQVEKTFLRESIGEGKPGVTGDRSKR